MISLPVLSNLQTLWQDQLQRKWFAMFVVHDMKNKCSTEHANHATKLQKLWLAHALMVIVKKKGLASKVSICNH